jgi:hypothetical protein
MRLQRKTNIKDKQEEASWMGNSIKRGIRRIHETTLGLFIYSVLMRREGLNSSLGEDVVWEQEKFLEPFDA